MTRNIYYVMYNCIGIIYIYLGNFDEEKMQKKQYNLWVF